MNTLKALESEIKSSDFIIISDKVCLHVMSKKPTTLTDFINECEAYSNKIYGIPVEFASKGYSYSFFCKTWKHTGTRIACINTDRCGSVEYYAVKCVTDNSINEYEFEILC